jgi:hypothetical protein
MSRPVIPIVVPLGELYCHKPIAHRSAVLAPSPCFPVFRVAPFELALQRAERQIMIAVEFCRSRSARFEFKDQPLAQLPHFLDRVLI